MADQLRFRQPSSGGLRVSFALSGVLLRASLALSVAFLPAILAAPALAQAPPPSLAWRTFETEHMRVTFAPGLETLARRAADVAEASWTMLAEQVANPPTGRVDMVLTDHVDFTNGYAQTHPSNRIVIYARPPANLRELDWFDDWMSVVVSHELAHIFHLDATGGLGRAIRSVFGRVPMTWPVFPARGTPAWNVEGLAVTVESGFTGFGRIHGSFHEMVVRTAVLEDAFDPFERIGASSPLWPGDRRVYIYGSLFLDFIERTHGEDAIREIVRHTAGAAIPPFLFFDRIGRRALGARVSTLYDEWRDTLDVRYSEEAARLRAAGLTSGTRVTTHGRIAQYPRVAPDGWRVAYAVSDGREDAAIRIVDAFQGHRLDAHRRNDTGAFAWLADGSGFVHAQPDFSDPYHVRQDLWITRENGERRVTGDARIEDPDIAPNGRVAAVRNGGGTTWPVLVDTASGEVRDLVTPSPDSHWADLRWSPGGTRLAAARWQHGAWALVVLDTLGSVVSEIPDEGVVAAPAWSPDGRYLAWSSDRTGVSNLYGIAITDPGARPRQITNVLTGAFTPEISPDGRTLWYAAYAADGFHLERMPFDPATWREPMSASPRRGRIVAGGEPAAGGSDGERMGGSDGSAAAQSARRWSPLPTLRPYYWAPFIADHGEAGTYLGASSSGQDVIGRHTWAAHLAFDPDNGNAEAGIGWRNARFGVPIIDLAAWRTWETLGLARIPDTDETRTVIEREDVLSILAIVPIRRWRWSAQLAGGVEYERETRVLLDAPEGIRLSDRRDDLVSLIGRIGFANYRTHAFSISREDGISLGLGGRIARERNATPEFPRDYAEVTASLAGYRTLPLGGFARPVLAARVGALRRTGEGAEPSSIGGVSGAPYDIFGLTVGPGGLLLPVRGFKRGVRAGTRAWTASAELRMPLAIPGRRPPWSPFFIDRVSLTAFGDIGDTSCTATEAAIYLSCQRANTAAQPLASVGGELVTDLGIGAWFFARTRLGLAFPVSGPTRSPAVYFRFGPAF